MQQLRDATASVRAATNPVVTVTTTVTFASLWLVPRLAHFQSRFEDITVHIAADDPEVRTPWLSWNVWLETMNLRAPKRVRALRFSHYDQASRPRSPARALLLAAFHSSRVLSMKDGSPRRCATAVTRASGKIARTG
ncbi:MAG: hypothetical protein ACXWIP_13870 [Burkholderiales bacterium]